MTYVLVILALLAGALGFATSSQATTGVALICGGCMLAIFARIAQASAHADELKWIRFELETLNGKHPKPVAPAYKGEFAPQPHDAAKGEWPDKG